MWRYVLFALVVLLCGLYAAPNLYTPDFALQISVDNSNHTVDRIFLDELSTSLEEAGIPVEG